MYSAICLAS